MPYGISSTLWAQMSPEDQNQVINDYYAAQNPSAPAPVPTIGGYVQPTQQQVQQAVQQTGLPTNTQQQIVSSYNNQPAPPPPQTSGMANPSWVYAVNMPSTFPDFAAMQAAGSGLVIASDDPNFAALVSGAQQHGVQFAIQVNAPPGITPQQYADLVSQAQQYAPNRLVLDIEQPGKGYPGSDGWNWSDEAASLLKPIVGSTQVAVTMEPNQADYNYAAYQGLSSTGSTQYWVQAYTGDMTPYDPTAATAPARAAVGDANVVTIFGPNTPPPSNYTGGYVSYGIPQTGASAAGIYAPGATSNTPYYPGQQPIAGAGSGATPGAPIYVNPNGQYGGGVNTPPTGTPSTPGTSTATGSSPTSGTNWASAYFSSFGLPQDVANKVNSIFSQYPDTDTAIQFALAYVRGTPWYQQTFPGIQYGMQHGIITNEQDYRQYVTALDTLADRYLGRHITGNEVAGYLGRGLTPDIVGKEFQGLANVQANYQDYTYYLGNFGEGRPSTDEMRSIGEEQAGLDSALGQKLSRALQQAMQRYSTIFQGNAATPNLSLGKTGLSAPSLLGGNTTPDVGA